MFVYKFVNENNEVVYVGKTIDLRSRIQGHKASSYEIINYLKENILRYYYQEFSNKVDASIMEIYYINKYNPILNGRDKYNEQTTFKFKEKEWIEYVFVKKERWNKKKNLTEKQENGKIYRKEYYEKNKAREAERKRIWFQKKQIEKLKNNPPRVRLTEEEKKAKIKEYYEKNKEKIIKKQKDWYEKNKNRVK